MKKYFVDIENPNEDYIREAADLIRAGGLVIFPTETVYGLACDATNAKAARKVYEAKGRGERNPLPIQIAEAELLGLVAATVSSEAMKLAQAFWPGPMTLVIPRNKVLPDAVTAGLETVGVRVPCHPVALALLEEVGIPIVATSANISGQAPPVSADEAISQIGEKVDLALDAGKSEIGVSSTIIDVSVRPAKLLRQGTITLEEITKLGVEVEREVN